MKFRNFIKFVVCLMSFVIVLSSCNIVQVFATIANSDSVISLDGEYSESRVIVVLDSESSLSFTEYTTNDFSQIDAKSICDLTSPITKMAHDSMKAIADAVVNRLNYEYEGVDLASYKRIVCLELNAPGKENVIEAINKIRKISGVIYAGPDYIFTESSASLPTNDTYVGEQWAIDNIQLSEAWNIAKDASDVMIGILDSGIDSEHPDLQGKVLTQYCKDFTKDKDDDSTNDNDTSTVLPDDDIGHGTMVAGIIGADIDNGIGISGVCGDVKLVSLKITREGRGYLSDVIEAISYASSIGIDILNFSNAFAIDASIFSTATELYDETDEAFISAISAFPGLFVCAAGNNYTYLDNPEYKVYPAQFDLDNLITVVASEADEGRLPISNHGPTTTDIYAPGGEILSCFPEYLCEQGKCGIDHNSSEYSSGYHEDSGTSYAAPYVAGVAALLLSLNPNMSASTVKSIILSTVDTFDHCDCVSKGRLNAFKALDKLTNHSGHNYEYNFFVNNDPEKQHNLYCYDCSLFYYEEHTLYVDTVYDGDNGCDIACSVCGYSFHCDCNPEYGGGDSTGHYAACPDGYYSIFEAHNYGQYTDLGNGNHSATCVYCGYTYSEAHDLRYSGGSTDLYNHSVVCINCLYAYKEAHNWVWNSITQKYVCEDCGVSADYVPGIMSLPDPELEAYLASLSVEEREEFIASLPEDQVARVTALLPSDDEHLTE